MPESQGFYAQAIEAAAVARVRAEIRARREAATRQRIRGIRHANRQMPAQEIAWHVGVSAEYVEDVLGERSRPEGMIFA